MDPEAQAEAARARLRESVRLALWRAAEQASGNRGAAVVRARDGLLRELRGLELPQGDPAAADLAWRRELAVELERAASEVMAELAGRR